MNTAPDQPMEKYPYYFLGENTVIAVTVRRDGDYLINDNGSRAYVPLNPALDPGDADARSSADKIRAYVLEQREIARLDVVKKAQYAAFLDAALKVYDTEIGERRTAEADAERAKTAALAGTLRQIYQRATAGLGDASEPWHAVARAAREHLAAEQ
ncbi:hypothetical protein F5X71_34780 [Nocardia brasiliensis]|uniref:Uncharacterized protein n=1 Tax=Nocardia brasiliensis TaxID=37326 RepID=A0A6G9Y0S6_NOCBR|nr:hypothetical protein [Nocardia brasiliensis]QIS06791.1 hypothetical protein F5X71_34780 [Nocardia brasiliensis]